VGSTLTGVESADIVAAGMRSAPLKPTISPLIPSTDRSAILAWYTRFGACGVVVGIIVTGGLVQKLQTKQGWALVDAYRVAFWTYAVAVLLNFGLSPMLAQSLKYEKLHVPKAC
jgi:hypothetical protein